MEKMKNQDRRFETINEENSEALIKLIAKKKLTHEDITLILSTIKLKDVVMTNTEILYL